MHAPDPILTASIFCDRRLDAVVHGVVAPVLRSLRAADGEEAWFAWWVRYSKNGDHLKVRLHGPAGRRDDARRELAGAAEAVFAALPLADPAQARISRASLPTLDPEDEAEGDRPDRSLLWTTYRRSPVSFGAPQLLDDDGYVGRMTACLARAADLLLETTAPGEDGAVSPAVRQRALLRALVAGIAAAGLTEEERAAYLAYHRGWLVRFSAQDDAREADVLAGFDRQLGGATATVQQLRRVAVPQWNAGAATGPGAEGRWREAVAELCAWAAPLRRDPQHLRDPFTDDASFPLLFKALHGVANQVGLNLLNEAYVHHLLLAALRPEAQPEPALAGAGA